MILPNQGLAFWWQPHGLRKLSAVPAHPSLTVRRCGPKLGRVSLENMLDSFLYSVRGKTACLQGSHFAPHFSLNMFHTLGPPNTKVCTPFPSLQWTRYDPKPTREQQKWAKVGWNLHFSTQMAKTAHFGTKHTQLVLPIYPMGLNNTYLDAEVLFNIIYKVVNVQNMQWRWKIYAQNLA